MRPIYYWGNAYVIVEENRKLVKDNTKEKNDDYYVNCDIDLSSISSGLTNKSDRRAKGRADEKRQEDWKDAEPLPQRSIHRVKIPVKFLELVKNYYKHQPCRDRCHRDLLKSIAYYDREAALKQQASKTAPVHLASAEDQEMALSVFLNMQVKEVNRILN
ncbi:hypothetical protein J6590_074965 [Homalodisca vitripennis]|nr:hypothetical protein J6590_074965 [Homalodisca vitripennis]